MICDFSDRVPPQSRDAERAILSAMLADPGCIEDVLPAVRAADFYFDGHQKLFQVVADFATAGKPVDYVTVFEGLKARGQLDDAGGAAYLGELHGIATTGANAVHHANIIRDHATRRRILRVAAEASRDAMAGTQPPTDLIAEFEAKLFDIGNRGAAEAVGHIKPHVLKEIARLDSLGENDRPMLGIPTGFTDLDRANGGWVEGLYMIGARPSVGKSAFMLTSALAAVTSGHPALIFSLEMATAQLVRRDLAMLTGIDLVRFRTNKKLNPAEAAEIGSAADTLMELPIYLNDSMSMTLPAILSESRRMIRKHGVKIIFIDYLQIITPENRQLAGRTEQLELMTRTLKQMSGALHVPIICLAQLNRKGEKDGDKPGLIDFRGSGSIEQDADDCYMLWRIGDTPNADVQTIGLDVAKQRNGPRVELTLNLRSSCTRFEDRAVDV